MSAQRPSVLGTPGSQSSSSHSQYRPSFPATPPLPHGTLSIQRLFLHSPEHLNRTLPWPPLPLLSSDLPQHCICLFPGSSSLALVHGGPRRRCGRQTLALPLSGCVTSGRCVFVSSCGISGQQFLHAATPVKHIRKHSTSSLFIYLPHWATPSQ